MHPNVCVCVRFLFTFRNIPSMPNQTSTTKPNLFFCFCFSNMGRPSVALHFKLRQREASRLSLSLLLHFYSENCIITTCECGGINKWYKLQTIWPDAKNLLLQRENVTITIQPVSQLTATSLDGKGMQCVKLKKQKKRHSNLNS